MTPTPTEHPEWRSRINIHLLWRAALVEWGEAIGGPAEYEIFAEKLASLLASGVPAGEPAQHHPSHPAAPSGEVPTAAPFSGQHAIGGGELPARLSWQPIATAPKGERQYVLLLMAEGSRSVGYWDRQEHHKNPSPHWATEKGFLFGKTWDRANQPTHWMPLPAAPTPTGEPS